MMLTSHNMSDSKQLAERLVMIDNGVGIDEVAKVLLEEEFRRYGAAGSKPLTHSNYSRRCAKWVLARWEKPLTLA